MALGCVVLLHLREILKLNLPIFYFTRHGLLVCCLRFAALRLDLLQFLLGYLCLAASYDLMSFVFMASNSCHIWRFQW